MIRRPPRPPLFPYTTLSRSQGPRRVGAGREPRRAAATRHGSGRGGREPVLASPGRARRSPGGPDIGGHAGGRGGGAGRQCGTGAPRAAAGGGGSGMTTRAVEDRKSTRLNSSHGYISYAVFCLKKKKNKHSHL